MQGLDAAFYADGNGSVTADVIQQITLAIVEFVSALATGHLIASTLPRPGPLSAAQLASLHANEPAHDVADTA